MTTRLMYDFCSTQESTRLSVSPFNHRMDINRYENKTLCLPEYGIIGTNSVTMTPKPNLVDVENDLQGRVRPSTKCSEYMYKPRPDGKSQGVEYIKPVQHPMIDPNEFVPLPKCGVFIDRNSYDFAQADPYKLV